MRTITAGTMTIAILAILVGLVGAYAIRTMLISEPPPAAPSAPAPRLVPLAASDLPQGRVISIGDIGLVPMSAQQLRESNFPLEITMLSSQQIVGRRLKEPVRQGDPFLTTSFYLEGTGPTVSESLKPGYRAISVPLPDDQRGIVSAGTMVDVLFLTKGSRNVPEMTVSLVEGVEVLSTDRKNVALAVTHEDARRLETVQGRGTFSLVPRPLQDLGYGTGQKLTFNDVLGIVPPPAPFTTVIYRGGRPSVNRFDPGSAVVDSRSNEPEDDLGLLPFERPSAGPVRSQPANPAQDSDSPAEADEP